MNTAAVQNPKHSENAALADLYEHEGPRLRAFLARLSGEPDMAEDLCHDAFLKALRGWSGRRVNGNARAWLYQIARHTAYDYLRQRAHFVSTPLCTTSLAADYTSGDARDLTLALAELPPRTRAVLLLFGVGYCIQEIAALTGTTERAIKNVMSRGRARLRAQAMAQGDA